MTYQASGHFLRVSRSQTVTARPLHALPAPGMPTSARHHCILAARSCASSTPAANRALLDSLTQLQRATRAAGRISRLSSHPLRASMPILSWALAPVAITADAAGSWVLLLPFVEPPGCHLLLLVQWHRAVGAGSDPGHKNGHERPRGRPHGPGLSRSFVHAFEAFRTASEPRTRPVYWQTEPTKSTWS